MIETQQAQKDQKFMRQALALAAKGRYTAAPNPCVGCVIVKDDVVLGAGYHVRAGLPHAEVCAMRDALAKGNDIAGATAYVTLEPCSHYGLTPPCAKALAEARVSRVVCACTDPNPLVSGRGIKILEDAGITVVSGVLEPEALKINETFFWAMKESKPFVTVKCGMSLDGKTALASGESKWITSSASRQDVQGLRALNQAIMTSAETVLLDNPSMTLRYDEFPLSVKEGYPKELLQQPLRIVVDAKEQISVDAMSTLNIFKAPGQVLLVRLSNDKVVHETNLTANLVELRIPAAPNATTHVDMSQLMSYLHTKKIRSVLVEAGGRFTASLFTDGIVNKVVVYTAPCILGESARSGFALTSPSFLKDCLKMKLEEVSAIGDDVKLVYKMAN